MAERRVAQVVAERDRLGQLLVQAQHLGDGPRDLRHLEGVGQPRAVVVAGRREEDLRLVLQAPERLAVDDAVAVALERRANRVVALPDARRPWLVGALGRLRRQRPRARGARADSRMSRQGRPGRKLVPCVSGTDAGRSRRASAPDRRRSGSRSPSRHQTDRAAEHHQRHVLSRMIGAGRASGRYRIVVTISRSSTRSLGTSRRAGRRSCSRLAGRSRPRRCGDRRRCRSRRGW